MHRDCPSVYFPIMTPIAFLGTGLLGSGLAEAAAKRGDQVTVWNRTTNKARALEPFGIRVAATPADAVRGAERVHLVLKDDTVVDEVIAAFRRGLAPNAVIVDHTTTQPARTAARATRLNAEGVQYIHCPVFIGPAAAREGKGTILASGPRPLFDRVKDALGRMAPRVEYFGERPDLAAVYKLCGNAAIVGAVGVVADVLAIASSSGVTAEDALKLFDFLNPTPGMITRGRHMAKRNYEPSFELTMARKDVRLMMETANGTPLITLPAIAERMDALIDAGDGEEDLAILGKDAVRS
jgi:3-hydroxyisobutyrate dehydrogenase-like beta-hydroxyacid dehydrogenase